MPKNNKKIKGVIGFLTVASLASTAATIYVLLEDNKKANDFRKQLAELVNSLKDWKKAKLENKHYARELELETSKQIQKYEGALIDDKIKDFKILERLLNEIKTDYQSDEKKYSSLENTNIETLKLIAEFESLIYRFQDDNRNNQLVLTKVEYFKEKKQYFDDEYTKTNNESSLLELKNKVATSFEELMSIFDLSTAIKRAENINAKLPNNFKNKDNYESAIQDAINAFNSNDYTKDRIIEETKKIDQYNTHFEEELRKQKELITNEINALLADAEKYRDTTLDSQEYISLSSKLNDQIQELKNKMAEDNELLELENILLKANNLKPDASLVKEAIDQILETLPNAESALLEINSSPNTFESSNIKETLENAVNDATASLDTLNATTIKNAFVTLESNLNNANYLIKEAKDNTISETQTLIEKAKEESAKLTSEEYENKKELLDDTIIKVEKHNNNKTIIGDLIKNKNELEKILSDTRKSVARDNLLKAISDSEKNLAFIKENNVISPSTEFETLINEAKQILNIADSKDKSVDQVVNEYNEAAEVLINNFLEKAKLATNEKIQSSQELSNELGKDTYLVSGKEPGAKKDLDARIQSATTVKDSEDSITSDVLSELHKLNLAYNEAKRYKDADDDERNAIIRQIEALKTELESKSSELKGEKDNLSNENQEKYKPLIDELTRILEDYKNRVKPEVEDYGVARLNEVKKTLEDTLNSTAERKSEIDAEFEDLTNKLNELKTKANELLSAMATDEYNPEKENLQNLVNKSEIESNRDSLEELRALVKDFGKANKAAEAKIASVNDEKTVEIEKINDLVSDINKFISANGDEYPEIIAKLEKALESVQNDNQPTFANTLEEIKDKYSNLNNAFNEAKKELQDSQNKDDLSLILTKVESLRDKITSNDPTMVSLKNNLDEKINEAKAIIANNQTSEYVSEKNKLATLYDNSKQEIQTFEQTLADLKEKFKQALAKANGVLESSKNDENSANYLVENGLVSQIEAKIADNSSIDDNDPLESIRAKIDALNNIETFYNEEKAKIDEMTNDALKALQDTISSATNIKDSITDPAIFEAKEALATAITKAQEEHDKSPRPTIANINLAKEQLESAIQKANEAINNLNSEKQQLKQQISEKAQEIQDYINNNLNGPEYEEIKRNLETYLNDFNNNEANNLDKKTKGQLETLLNQMQTHLDSAKEQKNEKDGEINERNKQALINAKHNLETLIPTITSQDPEMQTLKSQLEEAINNANNIINNEVVDQYVSEKDKLITLKQNTKDKIKTFREKLEGKKSLHHQALEAANAKLLELKNDDNKANYSEIISDLENAIATNENISDDEALSSITDKTNALNQATEAANQNKTNQDSLTEQALNSLNEEISNANSLKDLLTDPALNDDKSALENAITIAESAHNHSPKLSISEINSAKEALKQSETQANQKLQQLNQEKTNLKQSIRDKASEIEQFINSLTNPAYDDVKTQLQNALNSYKNTNENALDSKIKSELESIYSDLDNALTSAKSEKNNIDNQIAEQNKQALIASRDAVAETANGLTNQAPEIVKLKKQLTDAIAETNNILDSNISSDYASKKEALDDLNTKAREKINDFNTRWNAANEAFNQALASANTKLQELKQNPGKYADAISNLETIIRDNNTSNENIDITDINAKTEALNNSVVHANIDKEKADAKAIVDTMGNLSPERKEQIKSEIDSVSNMQPYADAINQINEKVLAARKENYSNFVNNIPYPDPSSQATTQNKTDLINRLVNSLTSQTSQDDINNLETTLNTLKSKVQEASNAISLLPDGDVKNSLISSLQSANESSISPLITKIDKYSQILRKINSIPLISNNTSDSQNDVNGVNDEITRLKDALKSKLANVADNQLDNLSALVSKDSETVSHITSTFVGDIAISNNLIKELAKKSTAADAQHVYDVVTPIHNELHNFWWDSDKGLFIRGNKDNYPSSSTGILKPYDDFINNVVRKVTTPEEMRNINNNVVRLYHAGVDFNNKIKKINEQTMPQAVKDALKNKLLAQTDLNGLNNVISYISEPSGSPVNTGWYLDAYKKLNLIGNDANRAQLLSELKNVHNAPTYDVLANIKTVRDKIIAFKEAYEATDLKLQDYSVNLNKDSSLYSSFVTRLANITTLEQANTLKTDIQNAITAANKKGELKDILNTINYPGGTRASGRESILNSINAVDASTDITEMKNNLNALKSAMDRANTSLTSLPYPNGGEDAKNDIRTALNNATSASDVNRILPTTWSSDIASYKGMINELPSNRQNALNSRLSQTYPTSRDQSSSVSELKKQIIETHKVSAVQEINNIQGLEQTRKNTFISSINAISSNTDYTIEQMNQKIEEIREQVSLANEARLQVAREQAQAEINKLPTGNTIRNNLSSELNRASSISDYDTIKANAIQAKKELDVAKQNAQTAISKLPDGIEAKNNLNKEMASAKNKSDYESIKQKAEQEATKLRASIKDRVRLKLLNESYAPPGTIDKRLNWVDQRYIDWFNGQVDSGTLENAINLERQFAATKFFEKVRLNNIMKWLKNKVGNLARRDNRDYMDMISKFEQYDQVSNIRYNNRTGIAYSDRTGSSRTADDFAVLYTQAIPFSTPSEAQDLFNTIFQWQSLFNGTSNVNYGYFKNNNRNSIIDKSMKLLNDDLSNKSLTLDKIYEYSTLVAGLGDPATLQNHINNLKSNVPYVRAVMAEDSTYYFDKDGHRHPTKPLLG